jgi:hypothetical protein
MLGTHLPRESSVSRALFVQPVGGDALPINAGLV